MTAGERIEAGLLRWLSEPGEGALVDGARRAGLGHVARRAVAFAERLGRAGVEPGQRVAVHLDHVPEAAVALYGTWIAGAVAVPVNQALRSPQVEHILGHSGSRVLVSDARRLAALDPAVYAGTQTLEVPALDAPHGEREAPRELPGPFPGGDAPAALLYTSGSTGRPKGILVSHANLCAGARIVSGYLGLRGDERILALLPLSFDYGLSQLLCAVRCGATLVFQRSRFPADVLRVLSAERITALAGVPPFWIQLARGARVLPPLPHLRILTNSGGVFPVELVRRYRRELPHARLFLMYGLSEAFRSTYLRPEEVDRRPGSIGKAIPECEVLVLDERGRPCAPGEPGELVHRGPTVALGYWNDPEATARVFRPDPLHPGRTIVYSGDVVTRDEEGFLTFVARGDQLIKSHGYRVSPDEVEELIHASQLVAEVAVHGLADEVSGAVLVAHVVPSDPHAFQACALLEYCRTRMPAYMVPRSIEVHDAFPRTSTGKIDRRALAG